MEKGNGLERVFLICKMDDHWKCQNHSNEVDIAWILSLGSQFRDLDSTNKKQIDRMHDHLHPC